MPPNRRFDTAMKDGRFFGFVLLQGQVDTRLQARRVTSSACALRLDRIRLGRGLVSLLAGSRYWLAVLFQRRRAFLPPFTSGLHALSSQRWRLNSAQRWQPGFLGG